MLLQPKIVKDFNRKLSKNSKLTQILSMGMLTALEITLIIRTLIWSSRKKNRRRRCFSSKSITNFAKSLFQTRRDKKSSNIVKKRKNLKKS